MYPFPEPFSEDHAQTSPVHELAPPPPYSAVFDSPLTCPDPGELHASARFAEFSRDTLTFEDVLYNYQRMQEQLAKQSIIRRRKRHPGPTVAKFKPYVSFESTEMTVHQLRAIRDNAQAHCSAEKDKPENVTRGSDILSFLAK